MEYRGLKRNSKEYIEIETHACILAGMCQEMGIPGYEFT